MLSRHTVSVLSDIAALKRYDPNKVRGNAGAFVTLNVPVALITRLDMAVQREERDASKGEGK